MDRPVSTVARRLSAPLVATIVAALALLVPQQCLACSCIMQTFSEAADSAEVIFVGTAAATSGSQTEFGAGVDVDFTVSEIYRGEAPADTVVRTPDNSAACGFAFEVGSTYLVMAQQSGEVLETNLCTGTSLADSVSTADLDSLGEPTVIAAGSNNDSADVVASPAATAKDTNPALRWRMGAVGLTGLAMMAVIWWPRRERR